MTVTQESAHELYRAAFAPRPELAAAERSRLSRIAVGADVLAVLTGVWLLCAPLVIGYDVADRGPAAFWNAVATGVAIAVTALVRVGSPLGALPVRVAGMGLGGWLVVAPAVLGVGSVTWATVDEMGIGLLTLVLTLAGLRAAVVGRRVG